MTEKQKLAYDIMCIIIHKKQTTNYTMNALASDHDLYDLRPHHDSSADDWFPLEHVDLEDIINKDEIITFQLHIVVLSDLKTTTLIKLKLGLL
ncbi:MAG: hypothetical protein DRG78_00555 [Epsilonproteobacteria bacterium]|nr:MAG: hypothetical protein DRG78_00555 [Campylobacterota bacterium]